MDVRITAEPNVGASYDELVTLARAAEGLGFGGFFCSDHYLRTGSVDRDPGPVDSWITMAGLARETSRIRLGVLVTSATFRHPGPLAVTVAQVDAMSGGRIELGLGAGWYAEEHAAYGIPFPPVAERFDRLEEQLEIITGLWETPPGERFTHDGGHWSLAGSPAIPKPVQRPRPPIIVGGTGPRRTPALAARFAQEFNLAVVSADTYATQKKRVEGACEEIGRDPASMTWSAMLVTCCGLDEDELQRRAARVGIDTSHFRVDGAVGTPDEVVANIRRLADVGVERIYLQLRDPADLEHLELLHERVVPQL